MEVVISDHARFEIVRRQILEEEIRSVTQSPQQVVKLKKGRKVYQSKYYDSTEARERLFSNLILPTHPPIKVSLRGFGGIAPKYNSRVGGWEKELINSLAREMLLRVICEERHNLLFVVTAYRTSKIDKYWEKES